MNIDKKSQIIIKKAIEVYLKNSTILTIVNLIENASYFDKILVLEQGHVVEFDTPLTLSNNKNSFFYKLYNL